jgi:hypothetical protein
LKPIRAIGRAVNDFATLHPECDQVTVLKVGAMLLSLRDFLAPRVYGHNPTLVSIVQRLSTYAVSRERKLLLRVLLSYLDKSSQRNRGLRIRIKHILDNLFHDSAQEDSLVPLPAGDYQRFAEIMRKASKEGD